MIYTYEYIIKNNLSLGNKVNNLLKLNDIFYIPKGFFVKYSTLKYDLLKNFLSSFSFDSENVIIRSCANLEDVSNTSFAGLFDSIVIYKDDDIYYNIIDLYQKTDFENINNYKNFFGIEKKLDLNFIVQDFVYGFYSGVYFSKYNGGKLIEFIKGPNSLLVDGEVNSSKIFIKNNFEYEVKYELQEYYLEKSSKKRKYFFSFPKISENAIEYLLEKFKILEEKFDFNVDVEWTLTKKGLCVLQVRPITI